MSRAWTASSTPSSRDSTWNGKPAPSPYLHKQLDITCLGWLASESQSAGVRPSAILLFIDERTPFWTASYLHGWGRSQRGQTLRGAFCDEARRGDELPPGLDPPLLWDRSHSPGETSRSRLPRDCCSAGPSHCRSECA